MGRSQRMPREKRREQLIEVATRMFAGTGFHTTSMDDVADAAGVSKPVLYQHFTSKHELYLAVVDAAADAFETQLRQALMATEDNEQRVRGTFSTYLGFVAAHRAAFTVLFRSDFYEAAAVRRAEAVRRRAAQQIAELITRYTYATVEESMLLAHGVVGLAEQAAMRMVDSDKTDHAQTARLLAFMVFRGLASMPRVDEVAPPGPTGTLHARPWDADPHGSDSHGTDSPGSHPHGSDSHGGDRHDGHGQARDSGST